MNNLKTHHLSRKTVVLFDGFCHLCDGSVQFLLAADSRKTLFFAPLQSATGEEILSVFPEKRAIDSIMLYHQGELLAKADAVFTIASLLPWYWKWLALGKYIPKKISNRIYDFIAHKRYDYFGKRTECRTPSPQEKERFLV
jgi:predicted DCC family thiol-disulfide oxidoreductase YuxK